MNLGLEVHPSSRLEDECRMCVNRFIAHTDRSLTEEDAYQIIDYVKSGGCNPLGGRAISGCSELGTVICGVAENNPQFASHLTPDYEVRDKTFTALLDKQL